MASFNRNLQFFLQAKSFPYRAAIPFPEHGGMLTTCALMGISFSLQICNTRQ
jgi:hypothetical protein